VTEKRIALPDQATLERLGTPPAGSAFVVADPRDASWPEASQGVDLLVLPYMTSASLVAKAAGTTIIAAQAQTLGFEGIAEHLPDGVTFHNAEGVHETSTAELALGLTIASLRGFPQFARAQQEGKWRPENRRTLADRRVLVLGVGGVGGKVVERLAPFECEVTRVARSARSDEFGQVHGIDELPALLPRSEVVIIAVPLSPATLGLVNREFLAALPDGALIVNVSRGGVVDTDALLAETATGRLDAALDVTDPEPLPQGHGLWALPNVLITPHIGGNTSAMFPRVDALILRQAAHLVAGEPLENQVLPL
jgi:phosphoglycerate dehydrogenase-like enzyme